MAKTEWTPRATGVAISAAIGAALGAGPVIFYSLPLIMGPITAEFHWGRAEFSVVMIIASLLAAVCSPVLGWLTDRWGARPIMILGTALFGLAILSQSLLSGSLTQLYLMWIPVGITAAFVGPVAFSKVISLWFHRRRGLALGVIGVGGGIGAALMPQFLAAVIGHWGWRGAYVGMGLLVLVVSLGAALILLHEPPRKAGSTAAARDLRPGADVGMSASEARHTGTLWLILAAQFLIAISVTGIIGHSVPLLTDRGMAREAAATVLSMAGLFTIIGRVVSGWLLDRYNTPKVAVIFFIAPLLGAILLHYGAAVPAMMAAGILLGLGLGSEAEILGYWVSRYFGLKAFAEIYSYTYGIFVIGAGFGPFIMGVSYDFDHSYNVVLTAMEICMAVSVVLVLLLPAYRFAASRQVVEAGTLVPEPLREQTT
jgi:MFS family permease